MPETLPTWVHQINVFADTFQFHIQDIADECLYPETWNDDLALQLFVIGDKILGVGTVRDHDVDVTIEIFDTPMDSGDVDKEPDLDDWDQVIQCNINVPTGKILVTGATEDPELAKRLEIRPGHYGVRIFWGGLDTVDELGFEGDDYYKIMMWPNTEFEERVIKPWKELAFRLASLEAGVSDID